MSDMMTFSERLNLFKFNYETYKLAYNNNRYNLCKKLFSDEMLYFLDNTSYELMDSILARITLFEDLKLSRKKIYMIVLLEFQQNLYLIIFIILKKLNN